MFFLHTQVLCTKNKANLIGYSFNKTCSQAKCGTTYGACCNENRVWDRDAGSWKLQFSCMAASTAQQCRALSSPGRNSFWSAGQPCGADSSPCSELKGACCTTSARGKALCEDNINGNACTAKNGTFNYGKKCTTIKCKVQGACCIPTFNGFGTSTECLDKSDPQGCKRQGGNFVPGQVCSPSGCLMLPGACCTRGKDSQVLCTAEKTVYDCFTKAGKGMP